MFELINILNIWNHIDNKNRIQKYTNIKINSILNIEKDTFLDHKYQKFVNIIDDITKKFEKKQIKNIQQTLNIINYTPNHKWYKNQSIFQIKTAINWCKQFNVPYKSYVNNLNYKLLYEFDYM